MGFRHPQAVYRDNIASTPGPDVADRVHTAAAIGGEATVLLTKNGRDFPVEYLPPARLQADDR